MAVKKTIKSVDRQDAEIEIEDGEAVKRGVDIRMAKGAKHNPNLFLPGGIPYAVDNDKNTFVFSDTLKTKDKDFIELMNKKPKKGGYTYAELMKNLTTYDDIAMLMDPYSSDMEKETAMMNIYNKNDKANLIAAKQELDKGKLPPSFSVNAMKKRNINPEDLIPVCMLNPMDVEQEIDIPKFTFSGQKRFGYGGPVDEFSLFDKIKNNLNLSEEDKAKTHSQLLGEYGQQLIDIYNHFKDNPQELDKLYNSWSNNKTVKDKNIGQNISKDKFLDQYILWLYSKQAFKTTGEGGKDWSGAQEGSRSLSGKELQKRNASKSGYAETFGDFAGIDKDSLSDNITIYQTMDQAMNDYAKDFSGDNISITTNDYSSEDPNSDAGYASSTEQSGRKGVSVADGIFGQRTADFLPYIVKKEQPAAEQEKTPLDVDHIKETPEIYDDRFFVQDLNNLGLALRNRMNIRTPHYMLPDYDSVGVTPHYVDYRNLAYQAAANADTIGSAVGMSADPNARAAMMYSLADRTNTATANALSQEQNQNVNIANEFELRNAQIANQNKAMRTNAAKRYFDETEIGQQQKQNSITKANEELTKTYNQGLTNRQIRELLRKQNFTLTPDGKVLYTGDTDDVDPQAKIDQMEQTIEMLKTKYHLDPKDFAKEIISYYTKQPSQRSGGRINLEDLARYLQG